MHLGQFSKIFAVLLLCAEVSPLLAKSSSELIYTEPFDLAAGGTTLTRASQEGIVFANPALLPLGAATIRWIGLETAFIVDRDLAQNGTTNIKAAADTRNPNFVDTLFARSLHFGQQASFSLLNKNFAFSVFDRLEVDVEGSRYDNGGLPQVNFGGEAYAGGMATTAFQPLRWLSLGVTAKYLYMAEPNLQIPVTDVARIKELTENPNILRDQLKYGKGAGADIGSLFLYQTNTFDMSLGLKIEDVGGTRFTNGQKTLPQTTNAGLGMAFHGTTNVLHLSLDYRDMGNAYQEKKFKKVYLGARLMLAQMIGLAAGFYQGIPTFGVRFDAFFIKFGITAYGRELGTYPGDKQRNMVTIYTSIGF
ncbi:MAG: hypothetical protein H7249_00765 [Chitinophagaceae bacterium]|nr:hypothetical protein [Oligoflexus sp.]